MKALLPLLVLAACGSGQGSGNAAATENQIERLSTPQVKEQDPSATARLQPIAVAELDRLGLLGAGCDFGTDAGMLLAAVNNEAVIRIQNRIRHLTHAAPVGGTGGFFRGGEISVSIGRISEVATAVEEGSSWPARLTVTNRRTGAQQDLQGVWTCGS